MDQLICILIAFILPIIIFVVFIFSLILFFLFLFFERDSEKDKKVLSIVIVIILIFGGAFFTGFFDKYNYTSSVMGCNILFFKN